MAVDTAQTPWVWARTKDGRKVRLPKHLVEQTEGLTLTPSQRAKEPAKTTTTTKAKESDR